MAIIPAPLIFASLLLTVVNANIANDDLSTLSAEDFEAGFQISDWSVRRDFYDESDAQAKKLMNAGLGPSYVCELGWNTFCKGLLEADDCLERLIACDDYEMRLNVVCKGFNCTLLPTTPPPTIAQEQTKAADHLANGKGSMLAVLISLLFSLILVIR